MGPTTRADYNEALTLAPTLRGAQGNYLVVAGVSSGVMQNPQPGLGVLLLLVEEGA